MSVGTPGLKILCLWAVVLAASTVESQSPAARQSAVAAVRGFVDSTSLQGGGAARPDGLRFICHDGMPRVTYCGRQDGVWGGMSGLGPDGAMSWIELHFLQKQLLPQLDSAGRLAPNDPWIARVRSRYHALNGDLESVAAIVTDCRQEPWWCEAWKGWERHLSGDIAAAERHFDRSLALMPEERRCFWEDVSQLMSTIPESEEYLAIPCGERGDLNALIWWLGDPLLSDDYNDRRSEHFARWVGVELVRDEIEVAFRFVVPYSNRDWYPQLFLRGGGGRYCIRLEVAYASNCGRSITIGASGRDTRSYLPFSAAYRAPWAVGILDTTMSAAKPLQLLSSRRFVTVYDSTSGPRRQRVRAEQHYARAGRYATIVDAQFARMRRGEDVIAAVAFDPSPDSSFVGLADVAVAASPGPTHRAVVHRVSASMADTVRTLVPLSADSLMVSLEAIWPDAAFARHRFAVPRLDSAGEVSGSELIIYAGSGVQPQSLAEALPLMLPRTRVTATDTVGLFWELYGLVAGDSVVIELSAQSKERPGLLGSLGRLVGLGRSSGRSGVRWQAPPVAASKIGDHGEVGFSVGVDVSTLPQGINEITVSATVPRKRPVHMIKVFRVDHN